MDESQGKVTLVGAGPGDPELLTVKAVKALRAATVVLVDDLVGEDIVALAPAGARIVHVGKRGGCKSTPQAFIERLMVMAAREGETVVRLKGGDPFIFGRGGEEVEAVRAAGLPVEVIPGVSAALGCAAQAMLPLTHRDIASTVSFVAGQCKGLTEQDWTGLAGPGRTLVIYMGVATAQAIAEKLMADGLAPDTPVAILERGTLPDSRTLRTLLADLGGAVERYRVKSPAVLVVGEVVRLADAEDVLSAYAARAEQIA